MTDRDVGWLTIVLGIGPFAVAGDFTEAQLRRAWSVYCERLLAERRTAGTRPWGWWRFEVGEDRPDGDAGEAARLVELGVLDAEEAVRVAERAREWIEDADQDDVGTFTSPADAAHHMRAERRADAEEWRRLLTELDAPAQPPRRRVRRP
jgi:hypothetical protein